MEQEAKRWLDLAVMDFGVAQHLFQILEPNTEE